MQLPRPLVESAMAIHAGADEEEGGGGGGVAHDEACCSSGLLTSQTNNSGTVQNEGVSPARLR